ncbi:hypothetical protein JCM1840_000651 [Sporobolomyces johnsonii]
MRRDPWLLARYLRHLDSAHHYHPQSFSRQPVAFRFIDRTEEALEDQNIQIHLELDRQHSDAGRHFRQIYTLFLPRPLPLFRLLLDDHLAAPRLHALAHRRPGPSFPPVILGGLNRLQGYLEPPLALCLGLLPLTNNDNFATPNLPPFPPPLATSIMRTTALFAALLVLPSALALTLPEFDSSYGSLYQLAGLQDASIQHRERMPEFKQEVEKIDVDHAKADKLDDAKEADKSVAFENVQFEDVKFESTQLKVHESEEDKLKEAALEQDKLEKEDLLKFDFDHDGVLTEEELGYKEELEHELAADLEGKTKKEKDIDFENVQFQKVKFDSTTLNVDEHKDEKLKKEGKETDQFKKEKEEVKGVY